MLAHIGDGGEKVRDNRDHRPAVEVHEEGWPCRIRVAGDVDDSAEWGKLLGKGAYWMLVHIFGREDEAGIGPAGLRCSAGPWTTNLAWRASDSQIKSSGPRHLLIESNVNRLEVKEGTATAAGGSAIMETIAQQLRSTKRESIEVALKELNDMIKNYNSIYSLQKKKQWE